MSVYLTNAFSINMLKDDADIKFRKVDVGDVGENISGHIINAIGHSDTDTVVRYDLAKGSDLGDLPPGQRCTVSVEKGDLLLVAQYRGPRLEEGATVLPAGATIEYWLVTIG